MLLYFQKSAVRLLHGRIIRIYSSYMKRSPVQKQKGGDWWKKGYHNQKLHEGEQGFRGCL